MDSGPTQRIPAAINAMPSSREHFTSADLARIQSETFVQDIEFHDRLGSTNDRALQLAGDDTRDLPLLVLTDDQTHGRGRGANRWWSAPGALTFSLLLRGPQNKTASWPPPQTALAAGLSGCLAIDELLPDHRPHLKWPNDILLEGRKLCGVLIEVHRGTAPRMVVGIGVNVNNSVAGAPEELRDTAVSMFDLTRHAHSRTEVLVCYLRHLAEVLSLVPARTLELVKGCRKYCFLLGKTVECRMGTRCIRGICRGIDDDGALMVDTESGMQRCFSGEVQLCQGAGRGSKELC